MRGSIAKICMMGGVLPPTIKVSFEKEKSKDGEYGKTSKKD